VSAQWPWWEQYEEVADQLEAAARALPDNARVLGDKFAPLLFRAADDIRTLTDGLKSSRPGGPATAEEVLAMLPRDAPHAKHLREALKAAQAEEAQ
jgi:hypothetical protein